MPDPPWPWILHSLVLLDQFAELFRVLSALIPIFERLTKLRVLSQPCKNQIFCVIGGNVKAGIFDGLLTWLTTPK
jgi:hypothetical protein